MPPSLSDAKRALLVPELPDTTIIKDYASVSQEIFSEILDLDAR